jgi:hypothetical protein
VNELYPWWVYLHVFGAFAFAAGHGVSAVASFRIRATREAAAIRTLLDVSGVAIAVMYLGLLLLLVGGVAAGLIGGHFSRGWIWASLGILVVTILAMYMLATPFYRRLREAVGADTGNRQPAEPAPVDPVAVASLASSSRPIVLAVVGLVGFAVILWLMLFKPF